MRKLQIFLVILIVAITMTACGGEKSKSKEETAPEENNQKLEITKDEKVAADEVVVQVNDHDIKGDHYNSVYVQTKMRLYQFGQDIEDQDMIKEQTIEELVAQELFRQEAEAKGIEVTEKEIDTEFDQFKTENEGQLDDYLKEFNLSEDAFKQQVKYSLVLQKYIEQEIPEEKVSDKEIKEMYDQLKENNEDIPEYDEVKDTIKDQMVAQKQEEQLLNKLDELKKSATIEKRI